MCNTFAIFSNSVRNYPENVYVVDKDIKWTYSAVYREVLALADQMRTYSVNKGDRVLIYLDNSIEYIIAFFSILLVNCIAVPININTMLENIQYIVDDTSPRLVITNGAFLKRLQGNIDLSKCNVADIDLLLREKMHTTNEDFLCNLLTDSDLPAMILYTSGTTRMPKGVTLTHKNLLANTESILQYLKLTSDDSILATLNFCYSYGNSVLLTHTKAGGKIIIENRIAYPIKIIEQMYTSQVTGFSTVGSYLNIILKQSFLKECHFKSLRYITFAGESTNFNDLVKLHDFAPHIELYVMYGQTEATARLSYLEPALLFKKPGSIGKGIPGVILRVVSDDGKQVQPGETGEIIASGDNIMRGYWNNDTDTETVIRDGWLYTGDFATVDEDDYIYVIGRKDDIIKYLGHRISPVEIESVINSHDKVLESAVIGVENSEGKHIKAYVVPKSEDFDLEALNVHIRKLLPHYKRPHIIDLINELPRTSNGKIKRSELRKLTV